MSRRKVQGLTKAGWLHQIHLGVHVIGRRTLSVKGRWMAAVLACGPGAVLSHGSAAGLRRLIRTPPRIVEVTSPTEHDIAAIRTHICQSLEPQDRDVVDGFPCTSVALTLLNLAATAPRRQLEPALDEAETPGW